MNDIVTTVYVRVNYIICPHCDEHIAGWLNDPRGSKTECEYCGNVVEIAANAEWKLS